MAATRLESSGTILIESFSNFTGPLFSKKDSATKTKTPIMGYFVAGEFVYQKDGAPGAFEYYKAKDDVIDRLAEKAKKPR